MSIRRFTAVWSGIEGAPGYSQLYGSNDIDPDTQLAAVNAFWNAARVVVTNAAGITQIASGDVIDEVSGDVTGTWASGSDVEHIGSASGAYSAPVGAAISWRTGVFLAGRELRGRTFIVPCSSEVFTGTGQLSSGAVGELMTAAAFLVSTGAGFDPDMRVWHRPVAADGTSRTILSASVSAKAAVLRSRRD
jgi:hypothetical protein